MGLQFLLLLLISSPAWGASTAIPAHCCKEKNVGGSSYIFDHISSVAIQHGCLSNCTYMKIEGDGTPICFKKGDLSVKCGGVLLRRVHVSETNYFNKTFAEYQAGFSNDYGEKWMGLDKIHNLTWSGNYGVVVTLTDWDGKEYKAIYNHFRITGNDSYELDVGEYISGISTLGDALQYQNGSKFSTLDKDQDGWYPTNAYYHCSKLNGGNGGWWYKNCGYAYLTAINAGTPMTSSKTYIMWYYGGDRGNKYNNWAAVEMRLIPKWRPPTGDPGMVIQKRVNTAHKDGFNKTFAEYKRGFTSTTGEKWLGLDQLHNVTWSGQYGLRVALTDWDGKEYVALYNHFRVGPNGTFTLIIGEFIKEISTLADATYGLSTHNGTSFSTWDLDQDQWGTSSTSNSYSCSQQKGGSGGWWYKGSCGYVFLNGENSHIELSVSTNKIIWYSGGERGSSYKNWASTEMSLFPRWNP